MACETLQHKTIYIRVDVGYRTRLLYTYCIEPHLKLFCSLWLQMTVLVHVQLCGERNNESGVSWPIDKKARHGRPRPATFGRRKHSTLHLEHFPSRLI